MTSLWFDSFVLIGLCFILKYGSILDFIRNPIKKIKFFNDLFSCSLCLGFWIGLFFALSSKSSCLQWALYSSAICWFADHAMMAIKHYVFD